MMSEMRNEFHEISNAEFPDQCTCNVRANRILAATVVNNKFGEGGRV